MVPSVAESRLRRHGAGAHNTRPHLFVWCRQRTAIDSPSSIAAHLWPGSRGVALRSFWQVPRSPTPDPALSAVLKRLREDGGMTQETLAFHAGVSVGTLGRIETARTVPSWDTVRRIITALDVKLSKLASAIEAEERR